jgi:hypothetical protein
MSARYWWCRLCGHRIHYVSTRTAWVHDAPGADHGPIPTSQRPEVTA